MSDPYEPLCPCDDLEPKAPTNPPGQDHIAFRDGDWRSIRRSLLTGRESEIALKRWRPGGEGDLAVMMAEWWAYLADILTFYNERIANLSYLRTADRPENVNRLIRLLGYRPRPAIGARGLLAAQLEPGKSAVLPKGLQFQNKPRPGETVQTFELDQDTPVGQPDAVAARPFEQLLGPQPNVLLLQGEVRDIEPGQRLLLRQRGGAATLVRLNEVAVETLPDRSKQTRLKLTFLSAAPPAGARARDYRLERGRDSSALWTLVGDPVERVSSGLAKNIHLAGLVRQLRRGDPLMLTRSSHLYPAGYARLDTVAATGEMVWYANAASASAPQTPPTINPLPVPHTRLTLAQGLDDHLLFVPFGSPDIGWQAAGQSMVVTYGWSEVGRLKDQPLTAYDAADDRLEATQPAKFRIGSTIPALVEGASGEGVAGVLTSSDGALAHLGGQLQVPLAKPLATPLRAFYDLLPVSRGKSVKAEILGSGDARLPGQSFTLAKSPVTYLAKGSGWASTIRIRVNGHPWKEVASFYGQPADAQVFVTSEDEDGRTRVAFGDGVNGARLPTGKDNVVADYRMGAGAQSPPAGKLSILATPHPGLAGVRNPVAVGGGADPDPPDQIRRYAPRSVLTFGRAVSVMDYEALAAQAPGVTRARAAWAWDETRQRAAVTVYIGDDEAARAAAEDALAAAIDRGRPTVVMATPLPTRLTLRLLVVAGMDAEEIERGVVGVLTDEGALFSPTGLRIGQPVFDSAIAAAILSVDGVLSIHERVFATGAGFVADPSPLHAIGEGAWFDLPPERVSIVCEPGGASL